MGGLLFILQVAPRLGFFHSLGRPSMFLRRVRCEGGMCWDLLFVVGFVFVY